MKILIIGAGPTGLTAALRFAQSGLSPTIVEKRQEPSGLSRAVGIMPQSLDIWGKVVADQVRAEGFPFLQIQIHAGEHTRREIDLTQQDIQYQVPIGLPQDRTETLLREELQRFGISVQYGTAVTAVSNKFDKAWAQFGTSQQHHYDWIIGCDGVYSTVRDSLSIGYEGYDLDEEWSIADIELEEWGEWQQLRIWTQLDDAGHALISLPIGHQRIRLVSSTPDCLAACPVDLSIAQVRRAGSFRIAIRQAQQYRQGRILLAGDAAHAHSPVGGKGMNLGIEDAAAAVDAILTGGVDSYHHERHARGRSVIRTTEQMRRIIMSPSPMTQSIVRFAFKILSHAPFLQKIFIKQISQL